MNKSSRFIILFILMAVFFLSGCTKTDEVQTDLVVYSPHPIDFITGLVNNFENDTGLHVTIVQMGTGEILNSLALDTDNPECDVLWGGSLSSVASAANLFEDYTTPNEEHFADNYRNREGMFTRFSDIPSVIMVNRNLLGDISVEGYEDLLNPELKGKIAFADPNLSSSSFEHIINMLYAMGNGDPENGWNYVQAFLKNLDGRLLSSSRNVYQGVSDGTFAVGLTFEEGGANYAETDDNISLIYMKEGVVFTADGLYIRKGTAHQEQARFFVDYMTDNAVQTYISQVLNRRTVRNDVEIKASLAAKEDINEIVIDYRTAGATKEAWLEHFDTIWNEVQ